MNEEQKERIWKMTNEFFEKLGDFSNAENLDESEVYEEADNSLERLILN